MQSFSFQRIAPFYDLLARLIFGNTIDQAQKQYFSLLPKRSTILFIGGGSGRVLADLVTIVQPKKITYVEASSNMIKQAQQRFLSIQKNNIYDTEMTFIHGTEQDIPALDEYDVLMTFFLFDLYPTQEAKKLAVKLSQHHKPSGIWLFADFCEGGMGFQFYWKKLLLKLMYRFFSLVSNVQNQDLPDYQAIFKEMQYFSVDEKYFYHNFIISTIYRKLLS